MGVQFIPSIIGMNLMNVERQIRQLNKYAKMYHLDIIDWHFAENMSVSPTFIEQLCPLTDAELDVHLMVQGPPLSIIEACIKAGADTICVHAEDAQRNIFKFISTIHDAGKKIGVVLNPATPLSVMQHYLNEVDEVTFMGVTPGFTQQKLVPVVLDKIRDALRLREEKGYHFTTLIDGGCHKSTMKAVYETGVENIVMGATVLFSHGPDMDVAWQKMTEDFEAWTR